MELDLTTSRKTDSTKAQGDGVAKANGLAVNLGDGEAIVIINIRIIGEHVNQGITACPNRHRIIRHHRRIISAGNGDGLGLNNRGTVRVGHGITQNNGFRLARRNMVKSRVVRIDRKNAVNNAQASGKTRNSASTID